MMGSATLLNLLQASVATGAPGEAGASTQGVDFLAALAAALPAGAAGTTVAGTGTATPDTGAASTQDPQVEAATPVDAPTQDIAAMIASLLQAAAPAVDAPVEADGATTGEVSGETEAALPSAAVAWRAVNPEVRSGGAPVATPTQGTTPAPTQTPDAAASARGGGIDTPSSPLLPQGDDTPATATADAHEPQDPSSTRQGQAGLRQLLQMLAPQTQATHSRPVQGPSQARAFDADAGALPPLAQAMPVATSGEAAAAITAAIDPAQSTDATSSDESRTPASGTPSPAAATLAMPATARPADVPPPQTIHAPVGTPRWADEIGSRVALMSLRGQHEGSLNLTPEHLGPLEVRISVSHDTANVWFGSQHADTRAALTEALPRLRELLADAGLMLGQAGVSQQAPRQGARGQQPAFVPGVDRPDVVADAAAAPVARRVAVGLVDTYA